MDSGINASVTLEGHSLCAVSEHQQTYSHTVKPI